MASNPTFFTHKTNRELCDLIKGHKIFNDPIPEGAPIDGMVPESASRSAMISWLGRAKLVIDSIRIFRYEKIKPLVEEGLTLSELELLIPYGLLAEDDFEFMSQLIYDGVSELLKRKRFNLK